MNSSFRAFLDLVACDNAIGDLYTRKNGVIQKKDNASTVFHEQERVYEDARVALHQAKNNVDQQEWDMKELHAKEAQKKKNLDLITSQKEYQSLMKEIEQLSKKQYDREQGLLDAWNSSEKAHSVYETEKARYEHARELYEQHEKNYVCEIEQIDADIARLEAQRPLKQIHVPAQWLDRYVLMRSRVPDPIIPVHNGICEACSYPLTQQDITRINRRAVIQCRNCYRLLYSKEAMERSVEADEQF